MLDLLTTHPEHRDHLIRETVALLTTLGACSAGCSTPATATVRVVQPDTLAEIDLPMCNLHAADLDTERDGQTTADGRPVARVIDQAAR